MEYNIQHNIAEKRFEVIIDNLTSVVEYITDNNGDLEIIHTKVPESLEGRGIASAITKIVLQYVKENSLKVYPSCPYSKQYIDKHPEYQELVAK